MCSSGDFSLRALFEYVFHDWSCGERIRPACIKRDVRHNLARFNSGQTVVQSAPEMIRDLRHLSSCDQRTDCNQAPVAGREGGPKPEVTKERVRRVLNKPRGNSTEVVPDLSGTLLFSLFI